MNLTDNKTGTHFPNPGEENNVISSTNFLINLVLLFVGLAVLSSGLFTCVAMSRTRRIPFAVRFHACIILVFDAMFVMVTVIGIIIRSLTIMDILNVKAVFLEFGRMCSAISWITITFMSIERTFYINFGYWYAYYGSKKRIVNYTVTTLLVGIVVKASVRYVFVPWSVDMDFDFQSSSNNLLSTNTYILGICLSVTIVCLINIYTIVRNHVKRTNDIITRVARNTTRNQEVSFQSTRTTLILLSTFVVIYAPLFISLVVMHIKGDEDVQPQFIALVFQLIKVGANPVLFAWRFKECRYLMVTMLPAACRPSLARIEIIRMNIYDIVVPVTPCRQAAV